MKWWRPPTWGSRVGRAWRGVGARGAVPACLALAISSTAVGAQAGRTEVAEGNRLYAEGRFDEAHERYLEALRQNPESPLIRFNAGNALYQSADFQRAMEAYQQAIESGDPSLASASWYNLGNALYRGQQLEASLEAYKQALRLDPTDLDAKHNLERVLEQMRDQEQQPQPEPQDGQSGDQGDAPPEDPPQPQDGGQQDDPSTGAPDQEERPPEESGQQDPSQVEDEGAEDPAGERPQPGQMTPEEAQRLLDAIQEDPGDVNRKPAAARGRRPRKAW